MRSPVPLVTARRDALLEAARRVDLLDAARRIVLVVGVGALGAAVCSTGVHLTRPAAGGGTPLRAGYTPASPQPLRADEASAVGLLRKAGRAERTVAYRGTKVFGSWSAFGRSSVLASVWHQVGSATRIAVLSGDDTTDGRQLLDQGGADLDERAISALTRRYALRVGSVVSCLGRRATVVEVTRGSTVAGRFWLDAASGLTLRRELYSADGRPAQMAAFLDVTIEPTAVGTTTKPAALAAPTAPGTDPQSLDADELNAYRRVGWVLPDLLPAGLILVTARELTVAGRTAVQLSYTDGLYGLSVFVQRGRLDPAGVRGLTSYESGDGRIWVRPGLLRHVVFVGGDFVYTIVTDAPDGTVRAVVAALPRRPTDTGLLAHLSKGIGKVGSWVNPFD